MIDFTGRRPLEDEWAMVPVYAPAAAQAVRFSGACRIEKSNPATTYTGAVTMTLSTQTADGILLAASTNRLLCKLASPINVDIVKSRVWMGIKNQVKWTLNNGGFATGDAELQYHYITTSFEIAGAGCATWNTKPSTVSALNVNFRASGDGINTGHDLIWYNDSVANTGIYAGSPLKSWPTQTSVYGIEVRGMETAGAMFSVQGGGVSLRSAGATVSFSNDDSVAIADFSSL